MKRYLYIMTAFVLFLTSCEKETEGVSKETEFAVLTMSGPRYASIVKGGTFTDPGVTAKEGETELDVSVSGEIDSQVPGTYDIVYTAVNQDGYPGSLTRTVAVLPSAEMAGVDISGTYAYGPAAGSSQISKLAPGFYLTTNVYSPASAMPAYIITVDGINLTLPLSSLSPYGPLKGTGTLSAAGALVYKVDVLNYGIVGSTRTWKKN